MNVVGIADRVRRCFLSGLRFFIGLDRLIPSFTLDFARAQKPGRAVSFKHV
jgi:hypothetical protein